MTDHASSKRYDALIYRTSGKSGLKLPAVSLGLWHDFGDATPMARSVPCCTPPSTWASRRRP